MSQLSRRTFLGSSLLTTAGIGAFAAAGESGVQSSAAPATGPIIDAHVYLSHWPFRRIPCDETDELVRRLRASGVVEAWAGSFDGVFHRDVAAVNARLAEQCRASGGFFVPFGTVNPALPDWEEDLRRCHEEFGMPGVRLHPNYHQYSLDLPDFARLLRVAAERGMIVQLAAWMEDERHQHPLMPVAEVQLAPLAEIVDHVPGLRLVLLNAVRTPVTQALEPLVKCERIYFDLAKLEGMDCIASLLDLVPDERVLFGSYAPMFYFESTLLKLAESAVAGRPAELILRENARGLLRTAGREVPS